MIETDKIDRQIIELLQADGRMAIQEIATQVSITSSAVRKRIQRLEDAKVMKIVAVTDFNAAGFDLLLAIAIEVENRGSEEVARELAELPQVFSVNLTTGVHDLDILVGVKNFEELSQFMHEELPKISGIGRLVPGITVDVLRYESGWVSSL
jgi:Lrp/AsnC family transcriptional regulator for asnA, asnC and gidA